VRNPVVSRDLGQATGVKVLTDLLARLEAATGPDRELDAAIHLAVNPDDFASKVMRGDYCVQSWDLGWGGISYVSLDSGGTSGGSHPVPMVTASLDAALGLVGRVLPGWVWSISSADPEGCNEPLSYAALAGKVQMVQRGWDEPPEPDRNVCDAHAKTPALAVLTALVQALISQSRLDAERPSKPGEDL
jgi:hypothetical protein